MKHNIHLLLLTYLVSSAIVANFYTHKTLSLEQGAYVTGNVKQLGNWDLQFAQKLDQTEIGNNWFTTIIMEVEGTILYKYFVSKRNQVDLSYIIEDQETIYQMVITQAQQVPQIHVMSFNIRYYNLKDGIHSWENRKSMVFKVINENYIDFLGVQEAERNQYDDLQASIAGMSIYGRSLYKVYNVGEGVPFMYNHNQWEILFGSTFWLSSTPDVPASTSYGNVQPRTCTWGRFIRKLDKYQLFVINCHLDHLSMESQQLAGQQIKQFLAQNLQDNEPMIFLGDINNIRLSNTYWILKNNEFRLYNTNTQYYLATFHDWKGGINGECIDYILVSKELKATYFEINRYQVDGLYPSDHYPIYTTLQTTNSKA